jgi:hypothetical protein
MLGHAEGAALGWGRLRASLRAQLEGHATGEAHAYGHMSIMDMVGVTGWGRVPAQAVGRLGVLNFSDLAGKAFGSALVGDRLGAFSVGGLEGAAHESTGPVVGSGALGAVRVRPLRGGHMLGSSGLGAGFTLIHRSPASAQAVEYDSQGPTNSDTIATSAVLWLDILVSNVGSSATPLYLMFFDATSPPSNGASPIRQPTQVPASGQVYVDLGDPGADGMSGRLTKNGLAWAASTTPTTLTIDSTSSLWVTVRTVATGGF